MWLTGGSKIWNEVSKELSAGLRPSSAMRAGFSGV